MALSIMFLGAIAAPSGAIVGGSAIAVQAAPWAVFVRYETDSAGRACTGSVIDASHVLTAAHCLYDSAGTLAQPTQVSVTAGVSDINSATATDLEQDRMAGSLRIHPGYDIGGSIVSDDVAVVALTTPLDLSGSAVKAIALPSASLPYPASAAVTIAGFGSASPTSDPSGQLTSMSAIVDQQGECGQNSRTRLTVYDNAVVLCAASPTSIACIGDSGSGAVITTGSTAVLVAVADYSVPGCAVGGHAIFTYLGAPEILQFVQGSLTPPTAPRPVSTTARRLTWNNPLVVGGSLTCSTSGWPEPVRITYAFVNATNGDVLQDGPNATYLLPASAAGTTITCNGKASTSGGTTIIRTLTTPKIKPAPTTPTTPTAPLLLTIEPLAPISARRGQAITLHITLKSSPGLSGTFKACAQLPPSAGEGQLKLCRSTSEPHGTRDAVPFALRFKIKPNAVLGTAHIAITGEAGTTRARTVAVLQITKS